MIITDSIDELRTIRWDDSRQSWAFVPTMGYLHEGHLSLIRQARAEADKVAVSIFVNPTQFNNTADLDTYPRNLEQDLAFLAKEKVDLVFMPNAETIYPSGFQTAIHLSEVTQPLEGASRPGHFAGVATIVAKLFNIVQPHRVYFGQKDAQQTAVIRQLITDLNFNITLVVCPTQREADGLAMSSRNVRLTPEQRAQAPIVQQALQKTAQAYQNGETNGETLRQLMRQTIESAPLARIDYVSVADWSTLQELDEVKGEVLLSTAVFFDPVRLIDNILIQ